MIVALINPAVLHNDHSHQMDLILAVAFYAKRGLNEEIHDNQEQKLVLKQTKIIKKTTWVVKGKMKILFNIIC